MQQIENGLSELGMSNQDRNRVRPYVNGGLGNWRNAQCIPPEHPCFATDGVDAGDGHCMVVVPCTFGTLGDFRQLCRDLLAKYPQASVFRFFEPFMGQNTGGQWFAVDPYPPPAGYFTGMTCT